MYIKIRGINIWKVRRGFWHEREVDGLVVLQLLCIRLSQKERVREMRSERKESGVFESEDWTRC